MKQYYRRSNLKNRLTLAAFLMAAIFLISIYYRSPQTSFLQAVKAGAVSVMGYVQLGAKRTLSPVYNGWIYILKLSNTNQQNVVLKEELSGLKQRLNDLRIIQEENERLRELLNIPNRKKYKTILAYPVGSSSNTWETAIIIDKGTANGVRNRMPVINKDGLVGQVVNAAPLASQVQLITDNKSGVAAEIVGRNEKGLIQGTYDNKLEMTLVRTVAKVKAGDMVVTSGLGGIYPRNLFIGRVSSAKTTPEALYMDIKIKSDVSFNNLDEVLVIKSPLPPNIDRFKE